MNSKIGTVDQYVERYIFFVERRYQKDEKFKKKVLEALQKIAVPPKALNVYPLDSPYLGCLAFAVTTEANSSDPAWKLSRKFAKSLRNPVKVFSDIDDNLLEMSWVERAKTLPWLNAERRRSSSELSNGGRRDGLSIPQHDLRPRDLNHGRKNQRDLRTNEIGVKGYGKSGRLTEMRQLSQPPGVSEAELGNLFRNYEFAGNGQVVYVIDTGFDPTIPELSDVKFDDWIYAGPFPTDEKGIQMTTKWHGTIVVSKVAGKITGVAQEAKIVAIEAGDGRSIDTFEAEGWIDGLLKTYDHIRRVNSDKNCIVNISFGFGLGYFDILWAANPRFTIADGIRSYFWDSILYVLNEFTRLPNVVIVSGAGNGRKNTPIDTFPAIFAQRLKSNRMVVVGGVDKSGLNYYQKADFVKVWAPARDLAYPCEPGRVDKRPTEFLREHGLCFSVSGTSFAAPTVAGILATMLSAGVPLNQVVNHMYSLAYPRVPGGPNIVYNGISTKQWKQQR
ncbi:uncharacterized protein DFL_003028 [Arthrobotrys flagrans]|uniref:Peptidase S8/S53 domain-containing protein n=1 Tax=Arthrobotrys flagrans TaxID=97331 RepID=A0A437ADG9_ARTFL|nr:hypothetical protein DFL_003028 [Arthrobotrys flagrans]